MLRDMLRTIATALGGAIDALDESDHEDEASEDRESDVEYLRGEMESIYARIAQRIDETDARLKDLTALVESNKHAARRSLNYEIEKLKGGVVANVPPGFQELADRVERRMAGLDLTVRKVNEIDARLKDTNQELACLSSRVEALVRHSTAGHSSPVADGKTVCCCRVCSDAGEDGSPLCGWCKKIGCTPEGLPF